MIHGRMRDAGDSAQLARFLRTATAAIEIESGFAGEVVIDPSVTNRSSLSASFLRDYRAGGSVFALRELVVTAGHVSTRFEEATVAASGGGPAPVATGPASPTFAEFRLRQQRGAEWSGR